MNPSRALKVMSNRLGYLAGRLESSDFACWHLFDEGRAIVWALTLADAQNVGSEGRWEEADAACERWEEAKRAFVDRWGQATGGEQ